MDSSGERLHPNWRALATVSYPLKRFVRSRSLDCIENPTSENTKQQLDGHKGLDVAKFYEEIIDTTASICHTPQVKVGTAKHAPMKRPSTQQHGHVQFERQQYFRFAMSNNVNGLMQFNYKPNDVNACDDYGWSALMMAACEGAADAVTFLLKLGVDIKVRDRCGNTAANLARKKGYYHIEALVRDSTSGAETNAMQDELTTEHIVSEPFYCDTCKCTFSETAYRQHQSSTVHQFNTKPTCTTNKLEKFNIPPANRGLQLMLKQGWDRESGLGPTRSGRLYPVKTVIRKERTGLGITQPTARVTHFEAFDTRATRHNNCNCRKTKPRNRNDIRLEKQREWKRERRLRRELC